MSDLNEDMSVTLTDEDNVEGKAAGPWVPAGPLQGEGNAIRQIFASGTLDGGTLTVEACMNGPFSNPNDEAQLPSGGGIVSLAPDVELDDLAVRAQQVFATRAHWLRVAVLDAGANLDVKVWLR